MSTEFKPGELVKLKVSNQKVTVKAFATKPSLKGVATIEDRYECVWFDGVTEQKAVFHKDVLESLAPYYDSLHFGNYE